MRPRMAFVLWLRPGDQPARRASWLSTPTLPHVYCSSNAISWISEDCAIYVIAAHENGPYTPELASIEGSTS